MAKKLKTRRFRITPDELKVTGLAWLDNKFTLTFTQYRYPKAHLEVVMQLDFWWIGYLAEQLHKVIAHARKKIDDSLTAMKGD